MANEMMKRAFWAYWNQQNADLVDDLPPVPVDWLKSFDVTEVSEDSCTLSLRLAFCAGERHCCDSIGCLCNRLFLARDWPGLRQWFKRAGVDLGSPLKVVVRVEIEAGALFALVPAEPANGYRAQDEHQWDVFLVDEAKPGEPVECVASSK